MIRTFGVVVTSVPSKDWPRFRLPEGAGSVAQMVERSLCMREVKGSMPFSSIKFSADVPEWLKGQT